MRVVATGWPRARSRSEPRVSEPVPPEQGGKTRQQRAAYAESQQRQTDEHKSEMIKLRNGKEARQADFKKQRSGRETEDGEVNQG